VSRRGGTLWEAEKQKQQRARVRVGRDLSEKNAKAVLTLTCPVASTYGNSLKSSGSKYVCNTLGMNPNAH